MTGGQARSLPVFDTVNNLHLEDGTQIQQCRLCGAVVLSQGQHLHVRFHQELASPR
jgi:hypothetical protein